MPTLHSLPPPACGCSMRGQFEEVIRKAQDEICAAVEAVDGCKFKEDAWVRPGGGGGISRVLQVRPQAPGLCPTTRALPYAAS